VDNLSEIIQPRKYGYFFFVIKQINILLLFLKIYVYDVFLILKNLRKDVIKYNLSSISIIYYAIIKYPLIGFRPSNFFMYKLHKNNYKHYLTFFEGTSKVARKNKHFPYLLDNKLKFKIVIKDKINTPELVAFFNYKNKKISNFLNSQTEKIVIKPVKGYGGKGFKIINSHEMSENFKNCYKDYLAENYIIQHSFFNDIFSDSVNTLRILTIKKNNDIEILNIILKVGQKSTKNIDNIGQGGICINVNLETGYLGKGYTFYEYGHNEFIHHPDTGFNFYNKTIPFFKEAKEQAIKAHKLFSKFTIIGWDIAITENGPIMIEGNRIPDLSLHQIHFPLKKKLIDFIN